MKNKNALSLLGSVVLILIGLYVVIHPGSSLNMVVKIVGIALIIYGAIGVVGYLTGKSEKNTVNFIVAILIVIVGLFFFTSPSKVVSFFPTVTGILLIVAGVRDILSAIRTKGNLVPLVLAIITLIFGLIILLNPFGTVEILATVFGIALIYNGITSLIGARKK